MLEVPRPPTFRPLRAALLDVATADLVNPFCDVPGSACGAEPPANRSLSTNQAALCSRRGQASRTGWPRNAADNLSRLFRHQVLTMGLTLPTRIGAQHLIGLYMQLIFTAWRAGPNWSARELFTPVGKSDFDYLLACKRELNRSLSAIGKEGRVRSRYGLEGGRRERDRKRATREEAQSRQPRPFSSCSWP